VQRMCSDEHDGDEDQRRDYQSFLTGPRSQNNVQCDGRSENDRSQTWRER